VPLQGLWVTGSVSGGCIEDDLLDSIKADGLPSKPALLTYGETAEEAKRLGLPCGGTMQLIIEPLMQADSLDAIVLPLQKGQVTARTLNLESGAVTVNPAKPSAVTTFTQPLLSSIYGPRYRLLIIGAGQISLLLAEIATSLDFTVTVCDPRKQYADLWSLDNVTLTRQMPDDVVINMQIDSRTAVVTLAHDPKLDDLALIEALKSSAFYVAAIGSKRSHQARYVRLKAFEVSDDEVAKLYGPAGLYIGSKTPSEIAVSIAAELVAVKNNISEIVHASSPP